MTCSLLDDVEGRCPPVWPDPVLRPGQVRVLAPHPLFPAGTPRLVLLLGHPRDDFLPDDIASLPGPCRTVHAALLAPVPMATVVDLVVPASVSGLGVDVAVMCDSLSTVRLEPGDDADRFGPVLGFTLPPAAVRFVRAVGFGSRSGIVAAVDDLDGVGGDWRTGEGSCSPGDLRWVFREDEVVNVNRLAAWW